jgi:hypothetical protein
MDSRDAPSRRRAPRAQEEHNMDGIATHCWLVNEDGRRWEVGPRGVLIGRSAAADVMLEDPAASRRSALIYTDPQGVQLVRIGRSPVEINGVPLEEARTLEQGDRITVPGCSLEVQLEQRQPSSATGWALRHRSTSDPSGRAVGFTPLPQVEFTVGGDEADDLTMPGWLPCAIRLEPALPGGWRATLGPGVTLNGRVPPKDLTHLLQTGDELAWQGTSLRLVDMASAHQTTMGDDVPELPWHVELQPVPPAGGQITVRLGHRTRTVWLPGLRFDLMQVLLVPLGSGPAGEPVTDAVVLTRVWGRLPPKDPKAVNTLVKRLRKDLEGGGLDSRTLVERAHGRTRFVLAEGAVVEMADPR